jgi:predicted transcriptional regulator
MKTKVRSDGFEGHKRRSLKRAERLTKGEAVEAEKIITFADKADMMACLSNERMRLIEIVRRKRLSVSLLAAELERDRTAVTRDVQMLRGFGLLRLRKENNPGHGVVQIVEPVADRLVMQVVI